MAGMHFFYQVTQWPSPNYREVITNRESDNGPIGLTGSPIGYIIGLFTNDSCSLFTDSAGRFILFVREESQTLKFITQPVHLELGGDIPFAMSCGYENGIFNFSINNTNILLQDAANNESTYVHATKGSGQELVEKGVNALGYKDEIWQIGFVYEPHTGYYLRDKGDKIVQSADYSNRAFAICLTHVLPEIKTNYLEYDYCIVLEGDSNFYISERGKIKTGKISYHQGGVFELELAQHASAAMQIAYKYNGNIVYTSKNDVNTPLIPCFVSRFGAEVSEFQIFNKFTEAVSEIGPQLELVAQKYVARFLNIQNIATMDAFTNEHEKALIEECKKLAPNLVLMHKRAFNRCVKILVERIINKTIQVDF